MPTILIIEDDPILIQGLSAAFSFHQLNLISAMSGLGGLELLEQKTPDLIILDLMLPDIDGTDVCRRIRERHRDLPIIILSAKGRESDKLLGFELGAHDYLTKPFSVRELMARIQVHLKRLHPQSPPAANEGIVVIGSCRIDLKTHSITRPEGDMGLTAMEQKLLSIMLDKTNQVLSREAIIEHIWGEAYDPSPKSLDNLIHRLRKKIEKDPLKPSHILNVHGVGYKLSLY